MFVVLSGESPTINIVCRHWQGGLIWGCRNQLLVQEVDQAAKTPASILAESFQAIDEKIPAVDPYTTLDMCHRDPSALPRSIELPAIRSASGKCSKELHEMPVPDNIKGASIEAPLPYDRRPGLVVDILIIVAL